MAWHIVGNRLTRFFSFPTRAARETFAKKVKALESNHNHKITVQKLGERAAIVRCSNKEDITTKDRFMGAAVDNAAKGAKGKGSHSSKTTKALLKQAMLKHALPNPLNWIGKATSIGSKVLDNLPGSSAFNAGGSLSSAPFANRLGTRSRNVALNTELGAGQNNLLNQVSQMDKPQDIGQKIFDASSNFAPGGSFAHAQQGAANLKNQLGNQFFPLALRGRGDTRNLMKQMENAGLQNTPGYKAISDQYNAISTNRGIAGTGLLAGGMGAAAYLGREPEYSDSPFQGIANGVAGLTEMAGAPTWANTMRQNPGMTTAVGGLSLAALLYLLMSRNGNQR